MDDWRNMGGPGDGTAYDTVGDAEAALMRYMELFQDRDLYWRVALHPHFDGKYVVQMLRDRACSAVGP